MDPDILVVGGGPAGCSAACLLASWGHSVRLVTRQPGDARLAVSVPPSAAKLFDAIGVSADVSRSEFTRSTGNTVWWGGEGPRVEPFVDGATGWQVETRALESVLQSAAAARGVTIERRSMDPSASGAEAPFVLDCSGRAGVLARAKGLRVYDAGPRTVALVAVWARSEPWRVPEPSHTLVESYETGWAWSVPTAAATRHIAVMVDPQRSGLARGSSAREVYLAEIAKTRVFRDLTRDAALHAGPWGWDASTYHSERYAGPGWLLAGDAASFIDPLSSAGVKKAMASGWLAAVVAHTWILRPGMRSHAIDFYSKREAELALEHAKVSRRFLAAAAPGHPHPFWIDRTGEDVSPTPAAAAPADVRDAFERLRGAPAIALRRNPSLRVEPRPAVGGREIVLEPRIVSPARPDGARYVHDVDLLRLVDMAPGFTQVPDLFDAYCRRSSQVPLPNFLHALATAVAEGWLVAQ